MPWSAQHISPVKTIASLAQKIQPSGTLSLGGPTAGPVLGDAPRVIPPAASVQTVNPTASQRTDAEPVQTMGAGTQNRNPRTAIADSSALPSANRLAARVGQTTGLKDTKLGSRSPSSAPAAFNLMQTSTFQTPYAPEFLTNAVSGLNETQSYTALMHDEWRNRLLSESQGNPDLLPALTAASVQSGAHFSWAGGGNGSRTAAPAQRQPSYWEQKLAMDDLTKATEARKLGTDMLEQSKQSSGIGGSWNFQQSLGIEAQDRIKKADMALALARKTLGTSTPAEMVNAREQKIRQQYYANEGWNTRSSLMQPQIEGAGPASAWW